MNKDKTELEHYFAGHSDLLAKFEAGKIERVTYMVFKQGFRRKLTERAPLAMAALERAKAVVEAYTWMGTDGARLETLLNKDPKSFKRWEVNYRRANVRRVAYQMLELLQGIEHPPVPDPTPEALEEHEKAYNHQLGGPNIKPPPKPRIRRMTEDEKRRNREALEARS